MKLLITTLLVLKVAFLAAQDTVPKNLGFTEYLAYVKQYHPVVRQAQLHLEKGEAELLRARGAFDPKLEVDYDRKKFKGSEYYELLNSTFKIPTWYGLELKAGFEQNDGLYLNPQRTVPPEGLFSAGITLSAAQGLIMDKRRAALRSAQALKDQTAAEMELMVSEILYEASVAYLEWARLHQQSEVYNGFVDNAQRRFQGISRSAATGEIAAIDTVEAGIALQDRLLQLEQTKIKLLKQRLEVSNFLWLENNVPVELQTEIRPDYILFEDEIPGEDIEFLLPGYTLEEHPKIQAMESKIEALRVQRRLKINNLLPKVDLEYNFLTPDGDQIGTYDTSNYKAGLKFSFPLFLRKERGEVKLANYKLEDASLEVDLSRRKIENKIDGLLQELESYIRQIKISEEMVENYEQLLAAEERKFSFGESSLFLIISRESKLIDAKLKQNELLTKFMIVKAEFYRSLGSFPEIRE
ncbi:TolC family protein [Salinimicrobium gaetbulicola]|uniref:TolC family protein n=1 Tax=Salinimicrobium gaetbulicola TaxID=999702 RepID=A0ABW3IFG4_9FLAO